MSETPDPFQATAATTVATLRNLHTIWTNLATTQAIAGKDLSAKAAKDYAEDLSYLITRMDG